MQQYNFDWRQVLVGNVPYSFFIEVIIRITFIYVLLLVSMRLMGKRMAGQVSRNELAALVSLAAAIGVPMQTPERGLLPAAVIAAVVVMIEFAVAKWAFGHQKFEKGAEGNLSILIEDGVLQINAMLKSRITKERLMAELRSKRIKHLGKVKRLYLEAGGEFTLIEESKSKPGLSAIPDWDTDLINQQAKSNIRVCNTCGCEKDKAQSASNNYACPNCNGKQFIAAIH